MHVCALPASAQRAQIGRLNDAPSTLRYFNNLEPCPLCAQALLSLFADDAYSQEQRVSNAVASYVIITARSRKTLQEQVLLLASAAELQAIYHRPDEAESIYKEALSLAATSSEGRGYIAPISMNLATIFQDQDRLAEARALLIDAAAICDHSGDIRGQAQSLGNLATVLQDQHDYTSAIEMARDAMSLYHSIGDTSAEVENLCNLSLIYADAGQHLRAVETCREAIALADQGSVVNEAAKALLNLGVLLGEGGESTGAELALKAAETFANRVGDASVAKVAASNLLRLTH